MAARMASGMLAAHARAPEERGIELPKLGDVSVRGGRAAAGTEALGVASDQGREFGKRPGTAACAG